MIAIGTTVYYQFGLDTDDLNSITKVKIYKGVVIETTKINLMNRKDVTMYKLDNTFIWFDEELLFPSLEEIKKYLKERIECMVNLKLSLAMKNIDEDKGDKGEF